MLDPGFVFEMNGVCKSFPGVKALDNVAFSVRRGDCHCLVGQNGAGKSTLIKILAGACPLDSGTVLLEGRGVVLHNPYQALRLGISVLYQELALNPYFNAVENIFMGRELSRGWGIVDHMRMRREAVSLIGQFGVDVNVDVPVSQLSIAQQQIVALAKALSFKAKVVVFDEPSAVLTTEELGRLFVMIRRLKEAGVTVIYISHRLEEIFQIGDMVTVLRDGRVIDSLPVSDVSQPELIRMMVGEDIGLEFPAHGQAATEAYFEAERVCAPGLRAEATLAVGKGEILGIFGLVGSGRTELAHALSGITQIERGEIRLAGRRLVMRGPMDGIRNGVALVPENRKEEGLVLGMSVAENTTLPILRKVQKAGFMSRNRLHSAAGPHVDQLRVKTVGLDFPVRNLSGGNQQKVVLAKWLAASSSVLIMDEPTRGIDVGAKMEIYRLIIDMALNGRSIILISSELGEVMGLAHRVLVMRAGRVVGEFDPCRVDQATVLARAMGVA